MLRFFSKIRYQLAAQNRTMKYLRYAIGEILLVVVGIVIALQVNNWNEYRKARTLERKVLKEIMSNLKDDLAEIGSDITAKDSVIVACDAILFSLDSINRVSGTFMYDVAKMQVNTHFDPNKSGYELLISKGVEIILNDSLRKSISYLYESGYSYYYRYEYELAQFKAMHIYPQLIEKFDWVVIPVLQFFGHHKISQENYLKLKNDDSFYKLILAVQYQNKLVRNRAKRTENRIKDLINLIDQELG